MKKLILLLSCIVFISCFTEPKKDAAPNTQIEQVKAVKSQESPTTLDSTIKPILEEKLIEDTQTEVPKINDTGQLLKTLNKIYSENSIHLSDETFILLDNNKGIIALDNYRFNVSDIIVSYLDKDYGDNYGRHHLSIECSLGESCIYDSKNSAKIIAIIRPFTSKKSCDEVVKIFNNLKQNYND